MGKCPEPTAGSHGAGSHGAGSSKMSPSAPPAKLFIKRRKPFRKHGVKDEVYGGIAADRDRVGGRCPGVWHKSSFLLMFL